MMAFSAMVFFALAWLDGATTNYFRAMTARAALSGPVP
jgi:hypothetical protein